MKRLIVPIVVLVSLTIIPHKIFADTARDYFKQGLQYIDSGKYKQATYVIG